MANNIRGCRKTCDEDVCCQLDAKTGWNMDGIEQELVDAIGEEIFAYYE